MVALSETDRSSLRGLFIVWAIASVPGLVWAIVEVGRFYGPSKTQGLHFAVDIVIQVMFSQTIVFGTIGYSILRLVMFRYDGRLPLGWFHPVLEDYRPPFIPRSASTLDRVLLGEKRRDNWRIPMIVTFGVVLIGFVLWFSSPNQFASLATRSPMGARAPVDTVVQTAVVVLATWFAYRRGGLLGCWGIVYGPVVAVSLYNDPGMTALGVLGALLEHVSFTAHTAFDAYLIASALRWLVTGPPDVFDGGTTATTD